MATRTDSRRKAGHGRSTKAKTDPKRVREAFSRFSLDELKVYRDVIGQLCFEAECQAIVAAEMGKPFVLARRVA